jgi:hypothetical protein
MALAQVEAEMDGGYGIYGGGEAPVGKPRLQAQAAQWVSREEWHPEQRGRWLEDGRTSSEVPCQRTEIVMDILRQGAVGGQGLLAGLPGEGGDGAVDVGICAVRLMR